jgi:hypothetical protein
LLWHCLLTSDEARRVGLPRLRGMVFETPPVTARLLEAAAAATSGGEEFSYGALEGRLNEADRTLLATLAFADHGTGESDPDPSAQVTACLDRMEARSWLARRGALKARIKAAEKTGDIAEALRLSAELQQSEKDERLTVPQPSRVVE